MTPSSSPRPRHTRASRPVRIALLAPTSGPTGMYGASCHACAELAVEQINATTGMLGRPVELVRVDAGRDPRVVAEDVARLVDTGAVDAIAGWHISSVRNAVTARVGGRVLYAYAAMHEGRDQTPGVYLLGERPANQVLPAARRLADELGIRRWSLIGNDYVFPRVSAVVTRAGLAKFGARVVSERYVPLGTRDFSAALAEIAHTEAEGVLMFLMGEDAVHFNRAFAREPWSRGIVRLSPVVEEHILRSAGAASNTDLYASAAYFDGVPTLAAQPFARAYAARYGGAAAPLSAISESCYEAILFLAVVAARQGSLSVEAAARLQDGEEYLSPRGVLRLRGNLVEQEVYLAQAVGATFDLIDPLGEQ